jgi:TonB-linked SusC/RagA family outer membrane protein
VCPNFTTQTLVLMSKLLSILLFLFAATLPLQAQDRVISGKVISADDNSGLPGVNVIIQGTTKGVSTDFDGNYTLSLAPGEDILVFSFVGFQTQTVTVGNQTIINVTLMADLEQLEEVVVIGYGTVKKSDLTGSVSSVRGEDLVKVPTINPMQSLQGKVAGLQVFSSSGSPGAGTVVRIRGQGTFNDSSPIYVVDGVILQDINFLNPADIQSMEVLKDASSTAIYGSRGANGVIIVTTKKGKLGQETPIVNVSAEYSIQQLISRIDLMNGKEYALYVNAFDPGEYNNPDALPDTDWQDLIFRDAPMQNYQASVTGASGKTQYYLGLGYFKQEGIIAKSSYERVSIKANTTINLAKVFRVGTNLTVTPHKQRNTYTDAIFQAYRAWPVLEPFKPDGGYTEIPGVGNPLAAIEYTNNTDNGLRGIANVFAELDILKAFTFKTSFSVDGKTYKNRSFSPVYFVSPQQNNSENDLTKRYRDDLTILWENTIAYRKEFGEHNVDLLAGFTFQNTENELVNLLGDNIIREGEDFWYINPSNINPNGLANPGATDVINGVDPASYYTIVSNLFRANYTFKDRYLFTATYRRDGSSKFSEENRYASFPSLAIGWNVINEPFMEQISLLSNLKFRASWGKIGNEKINYLKQYSLVDNGINSVFSRGEILLPGATFGVTGNPDLIWETTEQIDVGVEAGFLKDKLSAEIDYYRRVTDDILVPLEVPGYLGNGNGATITFNAGEILNSGFEFNLNWQDDLSNGIGYRIGIVGTTIHNEVLRIQGGGSVSDRLYGPGQITKSIIGEPIGSFFGLETDGIFQSIEEVNSRAHLDAAQPGDLIFVDQNGDNKINDDDRILMGSPIPTFIYGFNLGGTFKGIDLSVDFQGERGASILNFKKTVRPDRYNFESHAIDHWTPSNPSTSEPRASSGGYNWGVGGYLSDRFVESGDYLRLRSATIGYTLPGKWSGKAKMKTARIYLRGTNLFTKSKYSGYTPEFGSENPLDNKVDRGVYPVPTIYSAGVNFTF